MADRGLTPRIHRASFDPETDTVDFLQTNLNQQGYENLGEVLAEVSDAERLEILQTLAPRLRKMVQEMNDFKVAHGDFQEGNLMWNRATGDLQFIDTEGLIYNASEAQLARNNNSLLNVWEGRREAKVIDGVSIPSIKNIDVD